MPPSIIVQIKSAWCWLMHSDITAWQRFPRSWPLWALSLRDDKLACSKETNRLLTPWTPVGIISFISYHVYCHIVMWSLSHNRVSTVSAYCLAPFGTRPSTTIMMTYICACISRVPQSDIWGTCLCGFPAVVKVIITHQWSRQIRGIITC